jgi:hypothetical protein
MDPTQRLLIDSVVARCGYRLACRDHGFSVPEECRECEEFDRLRLLERDRVIGEAANEPTLEGVREKLQSAVALGGLRPPA